MSDVVVKKLKKYILFIAILFFTSLGIHLIYLYLYDGAESEAIEWGTISEAIIGSFPHFNPLVPSSDHNAYINGLLYRSMLQYSPDSESFEPDIVSCDLENLLYIECNLEANLLWSDESEIQVEDIKATLDIIKQTKVNPIIASLIEETEIEVEWDTISFKNPAKDINFLNIFLQPILPKRIIEKLDTSNIDWKFSEINGVYSGRFTLTSISQDETVGITKITFGKNMSYTANNMYIEFLILNLFQDEAHFLKNKNSFNIFNDRNNIIGDSIPRLEVYEYLLSQFVSSFFNIERMDSELRSMVAQTLDRETIIKELWKQRVFSAYNPFLTETVIDINGEDPDFESYLLNKWYRKKSELIQAAIAKEQEQKAAAEVTQEIISSEASLFSSSDTRPIQENLSYINSPTTKKYNFVSKDGILLKWSVDEWVDAVYVWEYKLNGFSFWDDVFNYRLSETFESITPWENSYKIYYETAGERKFIEEVVYIYNTDPQELRNIESTFFRNSPLDEVKTSKDNALLLKSDTLKELESLDNDFYYDENGNTYNLKLVYARSDALMEKTVETIKDLFRKKWVEIQTRWLSLWEITASLRDENLEYDIVLIGINLGYFDSDIFPYFHSSQIENGYNFSNFEKLSLDILLEELKSNNLSASKRTELTTKILDILAKENIAKVLYTPKIQLLVDKNIKNFNFPLYLPDSRHRYFPILDSYLEEKKSINFDEKWFWGFIRYLFLQLLAQ